MLRLAGLLGAVAVGLVAIIAHRLASGDALEARRVAASDELSRAERMHGRTARLQALEMTNLALGLSRDAELGAALGTRPEAARRKAVHRIIEARGESLGGRTQPPDLVMVADAAGTLLARNLDPLAGGEDLKQRSPAVQQTLAGTIGADVWSVDRRMMRVGLAPVRGEGGAVLGMVAVGTAVSSADARAERAVLGVEVAYVVAGQLAASSFTGPGGKTEDVAAGGELLAALPEAVLRASAAAPPPGDVTLRGRPHRYLAGPMPFGQHQRAMVVLTADMAAAEVPLATMSRLLALVGGLGALIALGGALGVARYYRRAVGALEVQLERTAAGDEAPITAPAPFLATLCDEIEGARARWAGERKVSGGGAWWSEIAGLGEGRREGRPEPAAAGEAEAAAEPEEVYLLRTFQEFVAARAEVGAPIEGVSLDQFVAKVREKERGLCERYGTRVVRFRVEKRDGQVMLRPVAMV